GRYPAGVHGLHDMAGNVWEWTGTLFKPYPYQADDGREDPDAAGRRVVRGGSFDDLRDLVRCAFRGSAHPDRRLSDLGFRVVSPGL
ncbi:MAG TPA: SUMF1/EgtB/PvdO family nonheme iron enzyme, partial [Caldilineaceae bacterium]|nr:SUMF1/EgtB/PvdO family nonheme iron enzyme [Caldilineaceae bacterium]